LVNKSIPFICHSHYVRSHSWLSFGAEKIQERVWSSLFESHRLNSASDETTLYNPCLFKGYRTLHHFNESVPSAEEDGSSESVQKFIFMEGTGKAMKCRDIIRQTLWPEGCQPGGPCAVENIQHPPVDGLFFGIVSLSFQTISFCFFSSRICLSLSSLSISLLLIVFATLEKKNFHIGLLSSFPFLSPLPSPLPGLTPASMILKMLHFNSVKFLGMKSILLISRILIR
jgi:hypothetical protein